MKRRAIKPPYPLPGSAKIEWERIQQELGGLRGCGELTVWKAASVAETQGHYRQGQLNGFDLEGLKLERSRLGLSPLPDY